MPQPNRTSTPRFRLGVLGAILLVCGLVLAVLGFSGTGTFLGVMGIVIGLGGAIAMATALTVDGVR